MKSSIIFAVLILLNSHCFAQTLGNSSVGFISYTDDRDANEEGTLFVFNDEIYTSSLLGINDSLITDSYVITELNSPMTIKRESSKEDSIRIEKIPFILNGKIYKKICLFKTSNTPTLTTIEGIKEKHNMDIKGNILYIIDNYVVLSDIISVKVDPDFIYKIDVIPSSEIQSLEAGLNFTIVRIYTNRVKNYLKKVYMRMK